MQITTGRWIGNKKRFSKVERNIISQKYENLKKFEFNNINESIEKSIT